MFHAGNDSAVSASSRSYRWTKCVLIDFCAVGRRHARIVCSGTSYNVSMVMFYKILSCYRSFACLIWFLTLFVLLKNKFFVDLLVFGACLAQNLRRGDNHFLTEFTNVSFSHRRHHIALQKELFNWLDDVFGHLTVIMSHPSRHDKLRRSTTVLMESDGVAFWDQAVCLSMDNQGRTSHLFYKLQVFKTFPDD